MARRGTKKQNKRDARREQQTQREKERYGKRNDYPANKDRIGKGVRLKIKDNETAEAKVSLVEDKDISLSTTLKRSSVDQMVWLLNRQDSPKKIGNVFASALNLAYVLEKQRASGKRVVISFIDPPREDIENAIEEVQEELVHEDCI